MTDGILLAEIARDRDLRRYDTLIIDEAHERSLNIDFILGYLQAAAAAPPGPQGDHHLGDHRPGAVRRRTSAARPIIEVSGRTYPVEVRYRPLDEDADQAPGDQRRGRRAVGRGPRRHPGLPVRRARDPRHRRRADAAATGTEILPLYARLSAAEQHRVFERARHQPARRVVLATNVAETSLTVPGIRYVIDPGTARISRYSLRHQGAAAADRADLAGQANQRKGRCGRVADGICIRLYSRGGLRVPPRVHRPRDPAHQPGLGHPADGRRSASATSPTFPFVDPPDRAQHRRRRRRCSTSWAPFKNGRLTEPGPQAGPAAGRPAPRPDDPRGRPATAASARCWSSPPRCPSRTRASGPPTASRPPTTAHRRFADPDSDFLAFLNAVGLPRRAAARAVLLAPSAACAAPSS